MLFAGKRQVIGLGIRRKAAGIFEIGHTTEHALLRDSRPVKYRIDLRKAFHYDFLGSGGPDPLNISGLDDLCLSVDGRQSQGTIFLESVRDTLQGRIRQ